MQIIEKTVGQVINGLAREIPDNIAVKYTTRDYCRTVLWHHVLSEWSMHPVQK